MTDVPTNSLVRRNVSYVAGPAIIIANIGCGDRVAPQNNMSDNKRRRLYIVNGMGLAVLILVALVIVYVMPLMAASSRRKEAPDPEEPLPPSPSLYHKFNNGAVCSDGVPCSKIGRDILSKNGSAIDAAIATLFCNGLVNSQSMGIGGGFLMVLYDAETNSSHSLIAREAAPAAATPGLYAQTKSTRSGARAIAVPGELRGYWAAHKRFGRLPWAELIQPTIKLCDNGYPMSKHQRDSLDYREELVRKDPVLKALFVNEYNNRFYDQGTIIRFKRFCETLRVISDEGGDSMYNGTLAKQLLEDIHDAGGLITETDLVNYKAEWVEPIVTHLSGDITVFGTPPPGSGVLLGFILKVLDGFHLTPADISSPESTALTYHRIVETFKYAFAKRMDLGDPRFTDMSELIYYLTAPRETDEIREKIRTGSPSSNPLDYGARVYVADDAGTAHVSVIDSTGSAVSVTSSINLYFGAGMASRQTGIILNSGMDDFSFPGFSNYFGLGFSPANRVAPGKRSLSSMCPTIVLDKGEVRMSIGASGGTKISTAVAMVIMRHLWFGEDLKAAVDASRIHHQLIPSHISYEYGMLRAVREELEAMGHNLTRYKDRGSIVCALARTGKHIFGNADYRKGGDVEGF